MEATSGNFGLWVHHTSAAPLWLWFVFLTVWILDSCLTTATSSNECSWFDRCTIEGKLATIYLHTRKWIMRLFDFSCSKLAIWEIFANCCEYHIEHRQKKKSLHAGEHFLPILIFAGRIGPGLVPFGKGAGFSQVGPSILGPFGDLFWWSKPFIL